MSEPAPTPGDDAAARLPRHTTPTWEVELLISGVAVFAMLQLPGWLDDRYFSLAPRFGEDWRQPLMLVYVYLKSAALILAGTFSLHLLLRAQWIALVGMYSVFPGGIRWERLRMGPVQREVEAERYLGRDATVERADNRATIVFSIGVTLASTLLSITVAISCIFALVLGGSALAGARIDLGAVFGYFTLAVFAPLFAAMTLDRRLGDRLREDGLARRALSSVLRFYSRTGIMQRGSNPTFSLLSSHGGEGRATLVMLGVFLVAGATIVVSVYSGENPRNVGSYSLFPAFSDASRTVDAAHYDDQRDPARGGSAPFIGSAIASQPYVRLVVPYQPASDAPAVRRGCAEAMPLRGDARANALLACLERIHAVALDGKPLAPLRYELGSDARTDRPALVAMIDVRSLAPGRHELQVARNGTSKKTGKDEAARPWRIPFWR
jgi:hypothetical protein